MRLPRPDAPGRGIVVMPGKALSWSWALPSPQRAPRRLLSSGPPLHALPSLILTTSVVFPQIALHTWALFWIMDDACIQLILERKSAPSAQHQTRPQCLCPTALLPFCRPTLQPIF